MVDDAYGVSVTYRYLLQQIQSQAMDDELNIIVPSTGYQP